MQVVKSKIFLKKHLHFAKRYGIMIRQSTNGLTD